MNVFGIGLPEMAVIAAVALLVFGPKRLPEFGRTLGKTLKGFQSASKEFEKEINKAMAEPDSGEDQVKSLESGTNHQPFSQINNSVAEESNIPSSTSVSSDESR